MQHWLMLLGIYTGISFSAPKSLIEIYQDFHTHPELSFQEVETSKKMAGYLRDAGYEVTENIGGHGVVAVLKNGKGKTVLIRADMDALPIEEQTGLKYASQYKGVMHACGHDVHITNLVSTARELVAQKQMWQGTVILIAQPAEERGGGAKAMLEDGLFKKFPKPDYAIALHVAAHRPAGVVSYLAGPAMATADSVDITVKGRGGHGAMPQDTIDPIVMASHLVLDLQSITSREKDPNETSLLSVGSIHCGTKHNIIPEECKIQITIRSFTEKERQRIFKAIQRKTDAAALSAGAEKPEIKYSSDATPVLVNDTVLVEKLVPVFKKVLGEENVIQGEKATVSEDFSRYGIAGVPAAMFHLGSVDLKRLQKYKKDGVIPPLHSSKYYPDLEKTIETGTKLFVSAVKELTRIEGQNEKH